MSFSSKLALLFACFALTACNTKSGNGSASPPRYAFLRFENLSGDRALDWTGRALSESLAASLSGVLDGSVLPSSALSRASATLGARPAVAPGISTERPEALLAGATHVVTGYIEKAAGQIRVTATDRDVLTGKTLRTVSATASSPLAAIAQLAQEFSPRAKPPITENPEALRDYSIGLESVPPASTELLRQATTLDPNFGEAWLALIGSDGSRNDRAQAVQDIDAARSHKLNPLSRAGVDLAFSRLNNDRPAMIEAMRQLASLAPADIAIRRVLADADTNAGNFTAAASDWRQVTTSSPDDGVAWNSLGYVRSYAGDYAGALAALQRYDRLRPKDANPQDSIGDLNYSFRKFKEAATNYLEAYKRQPDFQQGGDLYKAAWAKFQAGDKSGADALFAKFRTARSKSTGDVTALIVGAWLFRTGHPKEAFALSRNAASETSSASLRSDLYAQLAIWELIQGDRAQAAKDAAAIPTPITSAPIFIARFASLPPAPAAEWEMRSRTMFAPNMAALRELALGYALVLDGKRSAALPVWEQIVKDSAATDFFARALYAGLQGKVPERPLLPDPNNLNQFAGILDKL